MNKTTQPPITLYTYHASPYGMKVYWALQFKRLEFDLSCVNPIDQREVSFTQQTVVPVTRIGDRWKQDSHDTCLWLDELFPERPIAGHSPEERATIIAADQWLNRNLMALLFRSIIDKDLGLARIRNANKLSAIMKATTTSPTPWYMRLIWPRLLRTTPFVVRHAAQLELDTPIRTHQAQVLTGIEERISDSGFLSGTGEPSFADIALYSQVAFCVTYAFEGCLEVDASPMLKDWFNRMGGYFPPQPTPQLLPKWPLVRDI